MEVLSPKIRQRYFLAFLVIFVVVVPLLVLYASGYRISSEWKLIKTGGIYVDVPVSGASFYLDEEYSGGGTLFQKSFFTQNLLPGTYTVRIEREGYHDWRKELPIYPQLITNGKALLLPEEIDFLQVATSTATSSASRTFLVSESEYAVLEGAFAATSTGVRATLRGATTTIVFNGATTTVQEQGDIGLWKDEQGLHAWWLGSEERSPYFFCELGECERRVRVLGDPRSITHFDFYPDDNQFIIVEWTDGVFVTELDTRVPQNIQPLYPFEGAQFRVVDGDVYIRDGGMLLRAEL